jgi:hypothetical protein
MKKSLILGLILSGCSSLGGYGNSYRQYPVYQQYGYYYGTPYYGMPFNGYYYGYNQARSEDWKRWQAYQYGLSQGGGRQYQAPSAPAVSSNGNGMYSVYGNNYTAGQIRHYMKHHH